MSEEFETGSEWHGRFVFQEDHAGGGVARELATSAPRDRTAAVAQVRDRGLMGDVQKEGEHKWVRDALRREDPQD